MKQWVKDLTEQAMGGPPFNVGDIVTGPKGGKVKIVGGQYRGTYGLSNFWEWRPVKADGTLGRKQSGYGWR